MGTKVFEFFSVGEGAHWTPDDFMEVYTAYFQPEKRAAAVSEHQMLGGVHRDALLYSLITTVLERNNLWPEAVRELGVDRAVVLMCRAMFDLGYALGLKRGRALTSLCEESQND